MKAREYSCSDHLNKPDSCFVMQETKLRKIQHSPLNHIISYLKPEQSSVNHICFAMQSRIRLEYLRAFREELIGVKLSDDGLKDFVSNGREHALVVIDT